MDEGAEPPAKKQKLEDDSNSEPLKHEKGQDTDFTKDVDDSEGRFTIDDDKYNNYVHPDELERLHEFQVLDEVKSNDEDSNDEESDSSDGIDAKSDVPEEEIEKMLEEDLPEDFKGAPKQKEKAYITRQKVVLEEKGVNTFEVLPLDWMMVRHYSGMPVYMHRATRVCTLSKPYFLGKGNTRRHDIPISAIPCYAYRRALEEEEKQKEIDKQIEEQIKNGTWQQHAATGNKNIASINNKTDSTKSTNDVNSKTSKCPYLHGKGLGKHTQVPDNHDELIRKELDKTSESNGDNTDKLTEIKDKVANDNIDDKLKNLEESMEDDRVKENQDDVTKDCAENISESKGIESTNETPSTESSESNSQDIVIESKSNNNQSTNDSHDELTNKNGSENNATAGNVPDYNASNENSSGDNATIENSSENNAVAENAPESNATIDNNANNENSLDNNATNENSQENASKGGIPLKCQPVVLPGGIVMPPPRVETVSTSWKTQHLTHEQVNNYCKRLFKFKTVNIMHFKRWADRRKYAKARKTLQYPTLPEGTKLITIPAQPANGQENGGKANKRDWVMNMNGRSYLSVFHEYVRRALQKQPVYEFKQLENAATPYQATVYIGGMQYGVGHGSSKRAAKSAAARASIHILIPEMRGELDEERPEAERGSTSEPDFSFFDYVGIEDPRITEFCAATCEPSPHAILRTCLLRNFGAGDKHIHTEMKKLEYQKIELTMKVGKHTATVVCKNKKTAKQRASQAILQALHPHVRSWGSLLRLYGSRSVKSCKEKKLEEQQITLLQDAARHNEPNYAVLEKLRHEMKKLRERDEAVVPIGTLLLKDDLPTHSGSNLNNVDL
ncbi:double-stranded RNA binding motif domain-containing protein [Phthorimaea operculella]|nr:double-stranded RNA binding motif domain-containing protein [Phthorimaea operculella]